MFWSVLLLLGLNLGLVNTFLTEPPNGGKNWVVLVAGSRGWDNYRHQASVCHAYQIVHQHGIPDSQIVVMMYNDIAKNSRNPTPGKIINKPNGNDVYAGVPKDYSGTNVTPEKFLAVLKGDAAAANGKVLRSGPNDHVFVYFSGHGSPGLVNFPYSVLYAQDFQNAIMYMYNNTKYAKMVFYIEASYSGSMMATLPSNIRVYATTAAECSEKSWSCYYDSERQTYLGDVYSVSWMEDSDVKNLDEESLKQQYQIVKKQTTRSHVMEFGDMAVSQMMLSEFQGNKNSNDLASEMTLQPIPNRDQTPSPEVPLDILKRRLLDSKNITDQWALLMEINTHLKIRELMAKTVHRVVESVTGDKLKAKEILNGRAELTQHECYKAAVEHFRLICFNWIEAEYKYALVHLYTLLNLCEQGYPAERIQLAMDQECHSVQ